MNGRNRTISGYNMQYYDPARATEKYQMPILAPCGHVPVSLIDFNACISKDRFDSGVHFYIDDYRFERIWRTPEKYIPRLAKFDCVLTPDFSLYLEMPLPVCMRNVFRSRLIGQILQDSGINVIPALQWQLPKTFDFCFDGLPVNSVVSVSTVGVKHDIYSRGIWFAGMDEAIKRLDPSHVVVYGGDIGYEFRCGVSYIENTVISEMKKRLTEK